jgi:hypothetical protein
MIRLGDGAPRKSVNRGQMKGRLNETLTASHPQLIRRLMIGTGASWLTFVHLGSASRTRTMKMPPLVGAIEAFSEASVADKLIGRKVVQATGHSVYSETNEAAEENIGPKPNPKSFVSTSCRLMHNPPTQA